MTSHEFSEKDLNTQLETAFRQGGVIEAVAQAGLEQPELTPSEVGDIILPPKTPGEVLPPRYQLLRDAKPKVFEAADLRSQRVLTLATQLRMRQNESLTEAELAQIRPEAAVWVVEGGANRTSVVRRNLALEAMQRVYGNGILQQTLFQFGSERAIPQMKGDATNPEYVIAQDIAPGFLPSDNSLTEFGLNLASAQQSGYEVMSDEQASPSAQRIIRLHKEGLSELVLLQPYRTEKDGVQDGFSAVAALTGSLEGKQLVIATNGPYRPKDEAQAIQWAVTHGFDMLPPIALGDEPGYSVEHDGRTITTANRTPLVYVNEAVVLHRLLSN